MLPYFEINQIFLGPIKIYTWGLFVGLAFVAGYFWFLWKGRKVGLSDGKIIGLVLVIFLGAVVGSRILFLLQIPRQWLEDVSLIWRIDTGGLMLWGGVLGGLVAGWFYIKKVGWNFLKITDLAAPALALGIGVGRIGCFLINDHQGSPTNLPWGILWSDGIARHPVALYEVLFGLVMFGVLWRIQKKRVIASPTIVGRSSPVIQQLFVGGGNTRDRSPRLRQIEAGRVVPPTAGLLATTGSLFFIFILSYAFFRFFLDFFREAEGVLADPRWAGLTSSQWISLIVICFVSVLVIKKVLKSKK